MEVVELMKRRQLLVKEVQEAKWKGGRAVSLGKEFKMLHAGGDGKTIGVELIKNEEFSKEGIRVERCGDRNIAL